MVHPNPDEKAPANRVEAVYASLFEAISKGGFSDGRLPTEAELSQTYGVSRPTLREALSRLRLDGVITSRRGAGSFVLHRPDRNIQQFAAIESIADIQRSFVFRIAMESAAAGLAAELRTSRNLDEMRRALDRLGAILEHELAVEEDIQFHLAVMRASQNPYFVTTFEMITGQIRVAVRSDPQPLPGQEPCPPGKRAGRTRGHPHRHRARLIGRRLRCDARPPQQLPQPFVRRPAFPIAAIPPFPLHPFVFFSMCLPRQGEQPSCLVDPPQGRTGREEVNHESKLGCAHECPGRL